MRLEDISFVVNEGVNDPGIFKAVFCVGLPGSGKSTIGRQLLSPHGLRPIDVDQFYNLFKRRGVEINYDTQYQTIDRPRKARMDLLQKLRLGLNIQGTGQSTTSIDRVTTQLHQLGYDVAMMYVDLPTGNAITNTQQRVNRGEPRRIPTDFVYQVADKLHTNKSYYALKFGMNFFLIKSTNIDFSKPVENQIEPAVLKRLDKFIKTPPSSKEYQEWMAANAQMRKAAE